MDILLKTGDKDKIALARAPSMAITEELLGRLVPPRKCMFIGKRSRALAACEALCMEPSLSAYEALVFNRLVANSTIICGSCNKVFCFTSWILFVIGSEPVVKGANLVQEVGQTLLTADFTLQLQSTLKTDADQKLEIMCQTCDKREKFLGDTQSPHTSFLRFGEQLEERNHLLAQKFGFSRI